MTIIEALASIPGLLLTWHSFRTFNDLPDYDWKTMQCIHPGNKIKKEGTQ